MRFYILKFVLLLTIPILQQCTPSVDPAVLARRQAEIASEPTGNFFIGRRYFVENTRFWGYLRKPGTPWSKAKLVMMNEKLGTKSPDRAPEYLANSPYGRDNNHEYRVYGRYADKLFYDPNSNQVLPSFIPSRFELIKENPGYLFTPNEKYSSNSVTLTPKIAQE